MEYKGKNTILFLNFTVASSNLKNLHQQNFLYKENIARTLIM